ncbi:hypothetical protein V6Z11_D12G029900 [Gossypium hirsutum]
MAPRRRAAAGLVTVECARRARSDKHGVRALLRRACGSCCA